ncbi:MAG TPA: hypothetical protein VLQ93_08380 [Myxococcaceae bacterium]|nr:hypothetical protein [Myxococcaceae bacterium]
MNPRKTAPLLVAFALLLAASALVLRRSGAEAPPSEQPASGPEAPRAQAPRASPAPASPTGAAPLESARGPVRQEEDLVSYLRDKYGARIKIPYIQIQMLEDLMRHFQKLNPTGWEEDLLALLREAFPELYDELAARLRQRVEYGRWMEENEAALRAKTPQERRAAVWEERNRLFGEEAARDIWQAELRHQAEADTLATIDALPDATVKDRLARYKQGLEEIYGEKAEAYLQVRQQEVMNRFLELGSVQKELGGLAAEKRAEELRHIRQEMGLDEQALERWKTLDAQRDARWEAGSLYMSEREALAQQYSGAELEARLVELRTRYFGQEAEVIAQEEQSGFFRFTRPRVWGRN